MRADLAGHPWVSMGHTIDQNTERRHGERRIDAGPLGERGMRCDSCQRVWYSALAGLVSGRFACVTCGGTMHVERRTGPACRRRHAHN